MSDYHQIINEKEIKGKQKCYRRENNLICNRIRVEQLKEIGEDQED